MKQIFIINPTAGVGKLNSILGTVKRIKYKEDEIIYTRKKRDALDIVKKYPGCRIYAIGGDGTVNEVVNGLLDDQELVIVPNGTGNDFNRTINKDTDPAKILKDLSTKESSKVDIVEVNGYRYINSACFGFDSDVGNHVHDHFITKFLPHKLAYIVGAVLEYVKYPYNEVEVLIDGQFVYSGPVTLFAINNGKYYGGGLSLTHKAKINDGYLDVCLVKKKSKFIIPFYVKSFLNHTLDQKRFVMYKNAKKVEVHMKKDYECNVDGEILKAKDFYFHILESKVNLVYQNDENS